MKANRYKNSAILKNICNIQFVFLPENQNTLENPIVVQYIA